MANINEIINTIIRGDFNKIRIYVHQGCDFIQAHGGSTPYETAVLCKNGYYDLFSNNYPPPDNDNFDKIITEIHNVTPDYIKWLSIDEMLERNHKYSLNKKIFLDPYLNFINKLEISPEFKQLLLNGDSNITKMILDTYPEFKKLKRDYLIKKANNSWADFIKSKIELALLD